MAKYPAQILADTEVTALMTSFPPSKTGIRNKALVAVYLYGQLRCSEALDLRPSDLDLAQNRILVQNGKGNKRRVIGFPAKYRHLIQAWLDVRPDSEWVFCTHKGGRIGSCYIRKMFKRQGTKAEITKRVHPHQMRHQGAARMASKKIDIRIISKQLGHSNIAVTDRYIQHLCPDDVVEGVQDAW